MPSEEPRPLQSAASRRFACVGDRIFDGNQVLPDQALIVEGTRIAQMLPVAALPSDIPVIRAPGCTILPGLIDLHVHFMRWQGPGYLAHGVTTIRDTGNQLEWILDRRRECLDLPWPRILCQGPLLEGARPYHIHVSRGSTSVEHAVSAVHETLDAGADDIKLYVGIPPDWVAPMMQACHVRGHKAAMEVGRGGLLNAARAGVDEFFHYDGLLADLWQGPPPGWIDFWGDPRFESTWDTQQRVADDIQRLGVTMTPTLIYCEARARMHIPEVSPSGGTGGVPPLLRQWQAAAPNPAMVERWRQALRAAQRFTGLMIERGVPVLAGTDMPFGAQPPGLSLWQELALLVESGMTAQRALQAATADAAIFMRRPELGHLRAGSAADLVVVRGNPLESIPERPHIVHVVRSGVHHEPEKLQAQSEPLESPAAMQNTAAPSPDPWAVQLEQHYHRTAP